MNLPARNLEYVVHNYSEEFSACDKGERQGFNQWQKARVQRRGLERCSYFRVRNTQVQCAHENIYSSAVFLISTVTSAGMSVARGWISLAAASSLAMRAFLIRLRIQSATPISSSAPSTQSS